MTNHGLFFQSMKRARNTKPPCLKVNKRNVGWPEVGIFIRNENKCI